MNLEIIITYCILFTKVIKLYFASFLKVFNSIAGAIDRHEKIALNSFNLWSKNVNTCELYN
jgi:hypothetical protein